MISLIWATDKNNLVGKDNKLPWHYKEDLQYFKKTTLNKKVLMGKQTFDSIISYLGKPLPNRTSIVASLEEFEYKDIEVINDLDKYLKNYNDDDELFIIGGLSIYKQAYKYADKLYITYIDKEHDGNVYFDYSLENFELLSSNKSDILDFRIYTKK